MLLNQCAPSFVASPKHGERHRDEAPEPQRHRSQLQWTEAAPLPRQHQPGVVSKEGHYGIPVRQPVAGARRHAPIDDGHHVQEGRPGEAGDAPSEEASADVEVAAHGDEVGEGEHSEEEVGVGAGPA